MGPLSLPVRVVVWYVLLSTVWIVVTDYLALLAIQDPQTITRWQTAKGWLFVALSSAVLLVLLAREQRIRRRSEREAHEASTRLRSIFRTSPTALTISRLSDGELLDVNDAFLETFGHLRDEVIGKTALELGLWASGDQRAAHIERLARGEAIHAREEVFRDRHGSPIDVLWSADVIDLGGDRVIVSATIDVTEKRQTEQRVERLNEQLRKRVDRLEALRKIDVAITQNRDLHRTLEVVLDQVTARLEADAAAVVLADERDPPTLTCAAAVGFRSAAPRAAACALAEKHAARLRGARTIDHMGSADVSDSLGRVGVRETEGLRSSVAVPLHSHGRLDGVLLVASRRGERQPEDASSFLESLGLQTAIAISNARLLDDLARSNRELRSAYDRTIEGWARALDLKDEETEGHSRRVTDMTERLARSLGVPEEELVHIRRGALLHDIGKLGVPDRILLKRGPLTDEEWEIMKMHTVFAKEMLDPIPFLHPAMAIPYWHHERWDGTGYPDGLSQEEIPLEARIFAVVDVFDALSSDRPYRKAWRREDVVAYLRTQRAKHFDPDILDRFLAILDQVSVGAPAN